MSRPSVANERKDQIVAATVECISQRGYSNFSMQDVARVAGVSKGIIHYYFLSKDELMMAVLDKVSGGIEKEIHEKIGSEQDPRKKLKIFVEVCLQVVKNTKEYYQVNMDFWTEINQKESVRGMIAKHYDRVRGTCAAIIKEGQDKGYFRSEADPKGYAAIVISIVDGLSLQWLFDPKDFPYDSLVHKAVNLVSVGILSDA